VGEFGAEDLTGSYAEADKRDDRSNADKARERVKALGCGG
jgi:hypothetical protein